jgi:hypothetical protein
MKRISNRCILKSTKAGLLEWVKSLKLIEAEPLLLDAK